MLYLINSPVLTGYGDYQFSGPLSAEDARERLSRGYTNAIGHAATAELLSRLLGMPVAMNRIAITMQPGDSAIVLKLHARLPEGKILDSEQLREFRHEFALLKRLR